MVDIKFTPEQFKNLLKTVYVGNWMINAHRIEDLDESSDALQEFLFSKAHEFGLQKYQDSTDPVNPSREFEESGVHTHIEEYDEQVFWDQLAERMAGNQIGKLFTQAEIEKMDDMERFVLVSNFVDDYEQEFAENGLENVYVRTDDSEEE